MTQHVTLASPVDLSEADRSAWRSLLRPEHGYDSPFFEPDFAVLLHRYRRKTRTLILRDADGPAAVFTIEPSTGATAVPPGGRITDFHGPVLRAGCDIAPRELMAAAKLRSWSFNHQPVIDAEWMPHVVRVSPSRYVSLECGFEDYVSRRKRETSLISSTWRKSRKLAREVGELEFRWQSTDCSAFDQLLHWKSAQRKRTGTYDILTERWVQDFLRELHTTHTADIAGVLSTLTAGGRLVAAHYGLKSSRVFHYWFPAYDPELGNYSPGLILLLHMLGAAAEHSLSRFDFGKGDESYKGRLATGAIPLAEGVVDFNPLTRTVRSSTYRAWEWVKKSRFYEPANRWKRRLRSSLKQTVPFFSQKTEQASS